MKTYRQHKCTANHRSYLTFAKCAFRSWATWVKGEGPYALLAHCNQLTVTLWSTLDEAQSSKDFIDATGCGHACQRRHEIVYLDR